MVRRTSLIALCLAAVLVATAQAQFSFGIGTGGGSGFYYGRGGYYGRGYYPGYDGPGYRGSGFGVRIGNFGHYDYDDYGDRGYFYSRGQFNSDYVLPSNSVQPAPSVLLPSNKVSTSKPTIKAGDILLRSPADAPGNVGYGINDQWVYTMKPGQKQKLEAGRPWTIEFQRGIDGAEPARYALEPGIYEFVYSEEPGWDLQRVKEGTLPTPPESSPREGAASTPDGTDDLLLPAEPPPE